MFCGAWAKPVGLMEMVSCFSFFKLVPKPGETDRLKAARSKSQATLIVKAILRLATQTRTDTPASPTVVKRGVKLISDDPHLSVRLGDNSLSMNLKRSLKPCGSAV